MRVFVTGADGFVGRYLVSELISRGHQVIAGLRQPDDSFGISIKTVQFDLTDQSNFDKIVEEIKPDGIIHLAAQSMVQVAWQDPAATFMVNTIGTISLIEAVKRCAPNAKVIIVGSSEEYGLTAKRGEPLTEEYPCLPQNPYATSKLATGYVALQLAQKESLKLIHVRPFNHFGPGQREGFVISDFASQIARIEKSQCEPVIKVGDLSAKRDFTDVRDIVNGYVQLLESNVESGIYNICSEVPRTIKHILDFLIQKANIPIDIHIDLERFRPSEVPLFIGSARKIKQVTGWKPIREFEDSLFETLEWWRKQV